MITAHPDDESIIAPLLGTHCVEDTSRCSILVLTRGEGGGDPVVREQEMRAAATLFRANLTLGTLPDVMGDIAAGRREEVLTTIRQVEATEQPTVIITFDPAHGTTCHPAHRATGQLVLDAVGSDRVLLLETAAMFETGGFSFFNALRDSAWSFDVTRTWHYLIDDVKLHRSQFSEAQVQALETTPFDQRRVYLAPASRVGGAAYALTCP